MKCRWYAEFEGVCTNGECLYCGDTCPTCEHPEACKYAEEKPKSELNAEELVTALRLCAGSECEGCPNRIRWRLRQHHKSASRRHAGKAGGGEGREEAGAAEGGKAMSTTEERLIEWLYNNIASLIVYQTSPINANRTAIYDDLIEQQRVAISAVETCRQLKKSLFGKENVTNDELVRMALQLKSGRCEDREGAEKEEVR